MERRARSVLKLGLALLSAGVLFAAPYLLVPGVALSLLPLVLPAWARLRAGGASVRRSALPARVVEDADFEVAIAVRSGWVSGSVELQDEAMAAPRRIRLSRPRHELELRVPGAPLRRGRRQLQQPRLRFADGLGIATREVRGGGPPAALLVLPRIEPIIGPDGSSGGARGLAALGEAERARSSGRESPAELDLEGLRPYRTGAPASRIYWPALARTDELLERRFAHPGGSGPLVALDAGGASSGQALDQVVRAAASLVLHLARNGSCELLLPGRTRRLLVEADLAAWPAAHGALALVAPEDGSPHLGPSRPAGAIFWVTAATGAAALPAGVHGFRVSPTPLAGRPVVFSVAGCAAQASETAQREISRAVAG